jgi:hypothetical protein
MVAAVAVEDILEEGVRSALEAEEDQVIAHYPVALTLYTQAPQARVMVM